MVFSPGPRPVGLPAGFEWPARVDDAGITGPTRMEARGKSWRRTSRGLYVPADTPATVDQRIVEAAAVLPAYGAVTGWAALSWLGGSWYDGLRGHDVRPVTLALMDSSVRPQRGIAICEERLDPTQIVAHRGLRLTSAAYAVLHEVRHARSDVAALIAADMAAYDDLLGRAELAELVGACSGWLGIQRGRDVVELMDENSWSPAESAMRLIWTADAGLPRPLANRAVFDLSGRLVGIPDLLDPRAGVAGEYDGELHLESRRRRIDLEREGRFRALGLETVAMVTGELREPWDFVARLRAAYQRAGRRPHVDRRWTIEAPSWWVPTRTVAQRRSLTADERDRLLRHRRRVA